MLNHIKAIIKACDKLNLEYNILHKSQNVLEIKTPKQNLLFTNGITPFNSESVANICRDKDFTYTLFHNDLHLPKTVSFFDPNGGEEYKSYIEFESNQIICEQITNQFSFPVIVKRNSGSQGKNVFKCNSKKDILKALELIFDKQSNQYDYVALAQEFVNIKREFRVILFQSKIMLVYEKIINNAKFVGNLSPLHWEESKSEVITDKVLIKRIQESIKSMSKFPDFQYIGLDIVIDYKDKFWIIELNSHPGYTKFLEDNDEKHLANMFEKILKNYI